MTEKIVKLDVKDKKILYELFKHSRFAYSEISKNVGVSKEVVNYRINRLIETGVIKGFTTAIFRPSVGLFQSYAIYLSLQCSEENKKEIIKKLISNNSIRNQRIGRVV